MKQNIIRILNSSKTTSIKNIPQIKTKIKIMKIKFNKYDIKMLKKTDKDFFESEIIYQSILNKEMFEENYERLKIELFDIWDNFDYLERKKCIDDEMLKVKDLTNYFIYDDKIIRIAFFDTLLNSLYENQMIIFDLPQYYKLEKQFNDKMISVKQYRSLPYKAGFSSSLFLKDNNEGYLLFNEYTKAIYHVYYNNDKYDKYQFDPYKNLSHFNNEVLLTIANTIIGDNELDLIDKIVESGLCSKYINLKLNKYKKMLLKRGV
ncbi:MAG: hypothetical protein PHP11_00270 [Erysipelotrichaceae bacterium]|nr:hypothetical protein [Erysipelotrichaceae bacterium]MDD4642135.1 hypothetical protein [Erysipelotrichaceae bacterium]